jgi:hypothetical protein
MKLNNLCILISTIRTRLIRCQADAGGVSQVAAFHLVHQGAIADVQGLSRSAPVPTVVLESVYDDFRLYLLGGLTDTFSKRPTARIRYASIGWVIRQSGHLDFPNGLPVEALIGNSPAKPNSRDYRKVTTR